MIGILFEFFRFLNSSLGKGTSILVF